MKTRSCTSKANYKWVKERGGKAGRRGMRWQKVTFTLALKGLKVQLLYDKSRVETVILQMVLALTELITRDLS